MPPVNAAHYSMLIEWSDTDGLILTGTAEAKRG